MGRSERLGRVAVGAIAANLILAVIVGALLWAVLAGQRSSPAPAQPAQAAAGSPASGAAPDRAERGGRRDEWPADNAVSEAKRIAKAREGLVSFAAVGPGGSTAGLAADRQFFSASVAKVMLLVAELRRLRGEAAPLDPATEKTLEAMTTASDNDAADAIYRRVGDPGLADVADAAGMGNFSGGVGHWSNVKITAADMARFMWGLDELLDLPHGETGSEMLASVISSQVWGIPAAAPEGARIRFKGGWRPSDTGQLVHQAARVDYRGDALAIAVLTDGNPSQAYGEETIRLIAEELMPERRAR